MEDSEASSSVRLVPVISTNTLRYENAGHIHLFPRLVARGPPSRTNPSPTSDWLRFIHPEGQPYYLFKCELGFAVITEANIDDSHTQERVLECLEAVDKELQYHNIKTPSECELFLELGRDGFSCNYYFVDHVAKQLFWLEDACTDSLDIPAVTSSSHLRRALERLYWIHIEFFPMHHQDHEQEFSRFVGDLYNIISHGQADRLTSRTSTFPYTADTCKYFLKLLSRKRGRGVDGYTLCYAARLAGAITNQRFVTFYGEQPAQLDRLQAMYSASTLKHRWLLTTANVLMWGIPQRYTNLLEDLYVNEQVYADQWTSFVSLCIADWTGSLSWSFPVFIGSILLTNVPGGTMSISVPPVLCCAVSILSAACLHLRHQPFADSTAAIGAHYLRCAKSDTIGFLPSSVAFSFPRASCLWGMSLLTAQCVTVASHSIGKFAALASGCAIAGILLFILCVIYPEDVNLLSLFRSVSSLCSPRMYALDARDGMPIV